MSGQSGLDAGDFRRFLGLNAPLEELVEDAGRRAALTFVGEATATLLPDGSAAILKGLPAIIGTAMQPFGWAWNGFYVLGNDGKLHVGPAFGPPVCSELERTGGPLSSGMCFDALLLNQTLSTGDVKRWPGYVSCDSTSGLSTVSGLVVPVRDPSGRPVAVWDVDSTAVIELADVRFFDVLFATLARTVPIQRAELLGVLA